MQFFELWFGYMAVALTISSFVPQVWRTIKTQSVKDLSIWTLIIFVCSSSSWLAYGIIISDLPIILTNTIVFTLQLMLLIMKIRYQPGRYKKFRHLEHVAFWVENLEEMAKFYQKYFDANRSSLYHNPSKNFKSYFLAFNNGLARIELMSGSNLTTGSNDRGRQYGLTHLAIAVGSEDEVISLTNRLRGDGYKVIGEPRTTGDGYFESVLLDPEGNHIELTV